MITLNLFKPFQLDMHTVCIISVMFKKTLKVIEQKRIDFVIYKSKTQKQF